MLIVHHHVFLDYSKEKEFRIRPHSDIQYGNADVDERALEKTIKETSEDPWCLSVGAGDLIDTDRPSTRAKRVAAYAGREAELTQDDMKRMNWLDTHFIPKMVRMCKSPNQKRGFGLIGEIDGHHYELYQSGMTSTEYILNKMRSKGVVGKYLGEMMSYIVLHVHFTNQPTLSPLRILIHLQHGAGGSQYISSDLTQLERKTSPYFEADIFIRGHSTKKYGALRPILYPSSSEKNPTLLEKTIVMVNTGGYLNGYGPGPKASYVEAMALAPVTLGHVVIHVKIRRDYTARHTHLYPEYTIEF